ncbi:MAG: tRNA (cytidine(34)-2'-O)-methyltransferase [Elusimicrobiota bacterium]
MKVVLINPQIPPNTGNIARTCVANEIELILIGKIGFDLSDKALKRAGLDYWKYVKLKVYNSFEDFLSEVSDLKKLLFFSTHGKKLFWDAPYTEQSYLIFGSETSGFPKSFYKEYMRQMYKIPMKSNLVRSLNLATSCGIVVYEALRHITYDKIINNLIDSK